MIYTILIVHYYSKKHEPNDNNTYYLFTVRIKRIQIDLYEKQDRTTLLGTLTIRFFMTYLLETETKIEHFLAGQRQQ